MIKSRYYKIANRRNLKKWQISKSKTLQVKEMAKELLHNLKKWQNHKFNTLPTHK